MKIDGIAELGLGTNMNVLKLQQEDLRRAGEGLFGPRVPEQLDEAAVDAARMQYLDMTVKDLRALATARVVFPDYGPDARSVKKADYVTALARNDVKKAARDARYAAAKAADDAEQAQRAALKAQAYDAKRRHDEEATKLKARITELVRTVDKNAIVAEQDQDKLRALALDAFELANSYKALMILTTLGNKLDSIGARI